MLLIVFMVSAVMLSAIMLGDIMVSAIMLGDIMVSVIMLNVIKINVVALIIQQIKFKNRRNENEIKMMKMGCLSTLQQRNLILDVETNVLSGLVFVMSPP